MAIDTIKDKSTGANISFAPPPIAKVGRLLGPQAEGALMRPAAGFGITRDGSGLVVQRRAPQPQD